MAEQIDSKTPKIRFKGFEGEWERKRLGEIYTERNERGNDSLQILSVSIHSGISNGELDSETLGKQVRRSEDKSIYKHVYAGDLALNMMRAWQGAIGVATLEGMVSPAYITAIPDKTIYPIFMDCGLKRPQIVAQMNNLSYGVTDFRKRLYWDSFIRVVFNVPSVPEQKKIAAHFSHLDSLISLHQRKHDKLVTLKKTMLQKMFPQAGAATPEIRFKGFYGEWVEKKLHSLADRYDNLRIPVTASNRIPGNTPYYGANGIQGYVHGYTHEGEFILVAEDGANDLKNYPVQYVSGKIWVNNHAHVLQGKYGLAETRFLKYAFSQINVEIFLVGGGRAKLNAETMMQMELCAPVDIEEQKKIGTYFRTLDKLISKHATQLQKLQQIKSACLERMFV